MQHNSRMTSRSLLSAAALVTAVFALAACGKKTEAPATTTPAEVAAQNPDPHAAIVPEQATSPDTVPGTGPAEGGTAIGGVVAGQDADKPRDTGASEPTGGDGATQATTPPAK